MFFSFFSLLQMINVRKILLIGIFFLISACSSDPNDKLIEQGNWYQVGYHDGIRGREAKSIQELSSYPNANQGDYDEGYEKGVNEYCDPSHAYQIGLSGSFYQGVCDHGTDGQKFRMEWQRGWDQSH